MMAPSGPRGCMPLVATAKMTRLIDGGNRMPSAPDVAITPAPNRRWIAVLRQRRQDDGADADNGGDRRAGDRRKQRASNDAGQSETAIPMPDQRRSEIDHAAGDAAAGEENCRRG